jgi:uncharacterized protein YraI
MLSKRRSFALLWSFLLISLLIFAVTPVYAITRTVTNIADSGADTLRDVLSVANDDDVIVFDTLTMGGTTITLFSQITINNNVTIGGNNTVSIFGTTDRVFTIASGKTVILDKITIQSGSVTGNGGNILNQGTLTLQDSTVSGGNASGNGGNIYHSGTSLTLLGSKLISGGAVDGGNLYFASGTLSATQTSIETGFASGDGSGIYLVAGTATLSSTSFSGNQTTTGSGGGVYVAGGNHTFSNNTFNNNQASGGLGGGIYVDAGTVGVNFTTFSGNSGNGGAIANNSGTVTLGANILWGNLSLIAQECSGTFANDGVNIIQDLTSCIITDSINTDPLIGVVAISGGGLSYFPFSAGSSAENAITTCVSYTSDIIGTPRPMGTACDIGSYEIPTPIGTIVETGPFYVQKGVAFSQTFTTTGSGGLTWSVIGAGALPTGLTLNPSTGVVSGTVAVGFTNGTYPVDIQAQDYAAATTSKTFDFIVVNPLTLSPTNLDDAVYNQDYTSVGSGVTASGGTGGPYTYALTMGTLPTGLSLNTSTGDISGTTTAIGNYNISITATDTGSSGAITVTQAYTLAVVYPPLLLDTITAPADAVLGQTYGLNEIFFVVSGGDGGPYEVDSINGSPSTTDFNIDLNGSITGTATSLTDWTANITVRDGSGNTVTGNITLNIINPPPSFLPTTGALPTGFNGVAYSQIFTGTGGTAPYTYSLLSGMPPTGFTITGDTFAVPSPATGDYSFIIRLTDTSTPTAQTFDRAYTLKIVPPITLSPASPLPDATAGVAYSATFTGGGGAGSPYSYSATGLPSGLTLTVGGALSGTVTTAGTYNFDVTVTDSGTNSRVFNYSLKVNLGILPASLPNGTTGNAYSQSVNAIGATGGVTFSTSDTLPTGLTLSTAGLISGTPTATGTTNFTVNVVDGSGNTGSRAYSITVGAITFLPTTLGNGAFGVAYTTANLSASGGVAPYTYAVTLGALPTGMTLSTGGALSGTPTQNGTFNFTVTATDSTIPTALTGTQAYSLIVTNATLTVNPTTVTFTNGTPFSQTFTASGGNGTYTFAQIGALPTGVTFNAGTATLSGTPTVDNEVFNFTINVTDTATNTNQTGSRVYSGTVNPLGSLTITPTTLGNGAFGVAYTTATLSASGGVAPYTYTVTLGSLPTGMTLSTAGALSGTPTQNGTFNFTVTATDSTTPTALTGTQAYSLTITSATLTVNPTTVTFTNGTPFSQTFTASGGNGTYTFAQIGTLPTGVTFDVPTATLSGTPTLDNEAFNFTITATDTATNTNQTGSRVYSGTVNPLGSLTITPTTLGNGAFGVAYTTANLSASGGVAPYTYAVTLGTLPTGMTLSTGGALSGTPTQNGTFNFTVTATDSTIPTALTGTQAYSLIVTNATLTVNPATVTFTNGTPFSQVFSATGGNGTYTFTQIGTLPTGVTFNAGTATLSGTPTVDNQAYNFTINVNDTATSTNQTGTRNYTGTVNAAPSVLNFTPLSLPAGTVGVAYTTNLIPSGGSGTGYSFSGTAPSGLTLSLTGNITGFPTTAGTFTFNVTLTDSASATITQSVSLVISAPVSLNITPTTLVAGVVAGTYLQTLSATGGTAPYTFTGAAPTGLTLASNGQISGIPTIAGTYNFNVTVTDSASNTRTQTITLVVNANTTSLTGAGFSSSPSPSSTIDFGTLAVGATGSFNLIISETGISTLTISVPAEGILTGTNPSDFLVVAGTPPFSIADGGAPVTVTLQCKPTAEGTRIAILSINTNDPSFPIATYTLTCNGSGTAQNTSNTTTTETQFTTWVEVVQVRGLAVRTGPFLGASMLAIARPGNEYEVLGRNLDEGIYTWYKVRVNGIVGWSSGRYLKVSGDSNIPIVTSIFDELENSKDFTVRGNTLDNLNMYRRPSQRLEPFVVIPWGGEVKVFASTMQGGVYMWLYIEYEGQRGWVSAPWIRVTSEIGIADLPIR